MLDISPSSMTNCYMNVFSYCFTIQGILYVSFQTRDHNWAIYVNPVGVDATVKVQDTRCVAAGYRWNPYYTQLADPLNVSDILWIEHLCRSITSYRGLKPND